MYVQKRKDGYTLLELVIAIAVLVILAGFLAPLSMRYYRRAREARYMAEAKSVHEALKLYLMDHEQTIEMDSFELWLELMTKTVDNKNHVLNSYLTGKVTKGAEIHRLRLGATLQSYKGIEYAVDGYIIDVEQNGVTKIIERPDG